MTFLEKIKKNEFCEELADISRQEKIDLVKLLDLVARGAVIIPKNTRRKIKSMAIGSNLKTKVNANIGTSPHNCDIRNELEKLKVALKAGADTIMDLSTAGNLMHIRKTLLEHCPVPLGSVPIYSTAVELINQGKDIKDLSIEMLFDEIENQCLQGIDFITVHCGITQDILHHLDTRKRLMGIVSRGGSMLAAWMRFHKQENPLYENYDRLLNIAYKYDVTLSLGDGLRPGAVKDATDRAQIQELIFLGDLAQRAFEKGVQVMIEGPGHVPLSQVAENIRIQKNLCKNVPFYVLGPLPTDIAPGYDHITAAIGGALAASAGADFLCYVTPAEHLALPTLNEVHEGVIASKIAAHIGDMEKGIPGAAELDDQMSEYRRQLNWEMMYKLAIDPNKAMKRRKSSQAFENDTCSMCGDFCALKYEDAKISL